MVFKKIYKLIYIYYKNLFEIDRPVFPVLAFANIPLQKTNILQQ